MNNRRRLIVVLGAGALAAPFGSFAQPVKIWRVGTLSIGSQASVSIQENAFVSEMRELGWVEGRNVVFEKLYANEDVVLLQELAGEIVSRAPDLIFVISQPPAVAAFAKTRTIPIVFGAVADAVEAGLVQSLARPGGNVTGVTNIGWELGGKRLQMLKEALPKMRRVGVLVHATRADGPREQKLIESSAATLGVTATFIKLHLPEELDAAFASFAKNRVEAVLVTHQALFLNLRKRIVELATKQHLPVIGSRSQFSDDGALMSYGASLTEQIRRSAHLADKILKGTKPADIPVERPTKFELIINGKTAKALGFTIPQSLLISADKVIE